MNFIVNFFEWINPVVWVFTNLTIIYIGLLLLVFVASYQALFDPSATTGGKLIFRFGLSLTFVIAIIVIGIFLDPRHDVTWFVYPTDTIWWRPTLRLFAYGYVAFTITSLVILLYRRKFRPSKLKTAQDRLLVQPRTDTTEIPILHKKEKDNVRYD